MPQTLLKWYVIWYPECFGWAVMRGDFRHAWYTHKPEAIAKRDELNAEDVVPNNNVHKLYITIKDA